MISGGRGRGWALLHVAPPLRRAASKQGRELESVGKAQAGRLLRPRRRTTLLPWQYPGSAQVGDVPRACRAVTPLAFLHRRSGPLRARARARVCAGVPTRAERALAGHMLMPKARPRHAPGLLGGDGPCATHTGAFSVPCCPSARCAVLVLWGSRLSGVVSDRESGRCHRRHARAAGVTDGTLVRAEASSCWRVAVDSTQTCLVHRNTFGPWPLGHSSQPWLSLAWSGTTGPSLRVHRGLHARP